MAIFVMAVHVTAIHASGRRLRWIRGRRFRVTSIYPAYVFLLFEGA